MSKSDADEIEMKNLVDFVLSLVGLDVYRISESSFICQLGFQEGVLSVKDFKIAVSYSISPLHFKSQRGILSKALLNSFAHYFVGHKMYYLYPLKWS